MNIDKTISEIDRLESLKEYMSSLPPNSIIFNMIKFLQINLIIRNLLVIGII